MHTSSPLCLDDRYFAGTKFSQKVPWQAPMPHAVEPSKHPPLYKHEFNDMYILFPSFSSRISAPLRGLAPTSTERDTAAKSLLRNYYCCYAELRQRPRVMTSSTATGTLLRNCGQRRGMGPYRPLVAPPSLGPVSTVVSRLQSGRGVRAVNPCAAM